MNKTDRLKKADIMKRLREGKDTANPVSIDEFCWLLQQNGSLHNHGYFHYTTWGRLQKMLTGVDVGEKKKKRLFLMSASSALNDTEEKRDGFYVASFSFGEEEEVAMWTNYGVPKHEAVRIKFPMKAMTRWINKARDSITIYVQEKEDQPFHALDVKPVRIYFADIAYHGWNDLSPDTIQDAVRYMGEKFCFFKEKKWRNEVLKTNDSLLFKKRGWAYEREVRLIVQFDEIAKIRRYKKIAIPFDSVYDAMLDVQEKAERENAEDKKTVMYGPWYKKSRFRLAEIKRIAIPRHSSFHGELRMRSNCDDCKHKNNPQECTCPVAEWKL